MGRTHLLGILDLVLLVREDRDLGAHRNSELHGKVAETSEAGNADLGALLDASAAHRTVDRQASTSHRRGVLEREFVRNLEGELLGRTNRRAVSALSDLAVLRLGVIGVDLLSTVILVVRLARAAAAASVDLSSDDDAVADLDRLDVRADLARDTGRLVSRNERLERLTPSLRSL